MKLKKGQVLYIDNKKYTIINMIEFEEEGWIWQEYEIVSSIGSHKWLSVEEDENKQIGYCLYEKYNGKINTEETEIQVNNKKYTLYEKGFATAINYFGNADVDKYETCDYYDYISEDKKTILSVEKWEGEVEKSIGVYIDSQKIRITEEIVKESKIPLVKQGKASSSIFGIGIFLLMLMPYVISLFSNVFINKSVMKYLETEGTKYTYVTSVTNNTDNQKAKVYEASFSNIDETVKDIIDGVPEGITKVTDSEPDTDKDGIGLQTNNEYAYVYQEGEKIYIQVSSKNYINNSGGMYHSHYHHYYRKSYTSINDSSVYSNYAYSARQSSVNSRKTSGGGTSSGK